MDHHSTNLEERLRLVEAQMAEIKESAIREDERKRVIAKAFGVAWGLIKGVVVPMVVALITVWFTK